MRCLYNYYDEVVVVGIGHTPPRLVLCKKQQREREGGGGGATRGSRTRPATALTLD